MNGIVGKLFDFVNKYIKHNAFILEKHPGRRRILQTPSLSNILTFFVCKIMILELFLTRHSVKAQVPNTYFVS